MTLTGKYRAISAVALLAATASGCTMTSDDTSASKASPPPNAPAATSTVQNLRLPLDKYELSMGDMHKGELAQDLLTKKCMTKKGYTWKVIENEGTESDLRNRRRYGIIEMPVAKTFGYHVVDALLGITARASKKIDREQSLAPAEQKAALDPENGCYSESYRTLWKGLESNYDLDLLNKLSGNGLRESLKSTAVQTAMKAWSGCMREQGFNYSDTYATSGDHDWSKTSRPTARETKTAQADVLCQERTDVIEIWFKSETTIQQRDIKLNGEYFTRLESAYTEYKRRVENITSRESSSLGLSVGVGPEIGRHAKVPS